MEQNKCILLGCDEPTSLPFLLKDLQCFDEYNYISTTRVFDLENIIQKIRPRLIIISYKKNQVVLDLIGRLSQELRIPILCLTNKVECKSLQWNPKHIVFTQLKEYASVNNNFFLKVNSILLLSEEYSKVRNMEHGQSKHNNLSRYILELDQKNAILKRIKDQIETLYKDVDNPLRLQLIAIVNSIKTSVHSEKHWENFKMHLEGISPGFLNKLIKTHPSLTSKDVKYCCYLKLNLSNNDIGQILGINQESVRTHKYRMKKKMSLSKEESLRNHIKSIEVKNLMTTSNS